MKKLLLALTALGLTATTALATDVKATYVSQDLEYEHENSQQGGDISFFTTVGLKAGDWDFSVQGAKFASYDKSNAERRFTSNSGRVQLHAAKKVTPELKLGYKYRGANSYDRHYLTANYNRGDYFSTLNLYHTRSNSKGKDKLSVAYRPFGYNFGEASVSLYLEAHRYGSKSELKNAAEGYLEASFPLYSEGKFSLSSDVEFELFHKKSYRDAEKAYYTNKSFGRFLFYVNANYQATENFSVYASVGHEFRSFTYHNDKDGKVKAEHKSGNKNYQDITVGWKYKF